MAPSSNSSRTSSSRPGTTERDLGPRPSLRLRLGIRFLLAGALVSAACTADGRADPAGATVAVHGSACGDPTRGVGVVVGDGRVLTNAHVVAGATDLDVGGRDAVLVGFDANRDLALLAVPGVEDRGVEVATARAGDGGTLVAIDAAAATVRHRFEVRRTIRATGEDIYRVEGAERSALELDVEFRPGWSGSGLFDEGGRLVGVAFAESRRRPGVAYAVAGSEIAGFLDSAGDDPVPAGPCLP